MTKQLLRQNTRLVKCPKCEIKLPKNEAILHKKRYYHAECYDQLLVKERKKTEEKKLKQQGKVQNQHGSSSDYKSLVEYICKDLYGWNRPSGMILKQIKQFHEEYDYTYKGMELTLRYFFNILDNKVDKDKGIGIIPFVYEDATKQYAQKIKIARATMNEDLHKINKRIVKVSPKSMSREIKQIDIESI